MKTFLIPVILIISFFMTGCSKEEPSHEVLSSTSEPTTTLHTINSHLSKANGGSEDENS